MVQAAVAINYCPCLQKSSGVLLADQAMGWGLGEVFRRNPQSRESFKIVDVNADGVTLAVLPVTASTEVSSGRLKPIVTNCRFDIKIRVFFIFKCFCLMFVQLHVSILIISIDLWIILYLIVSLVKCR